MIVRRLFLTASLALAGCGPQPETDALSPPKTPEQAAAPAATELAPQEPGGGASATQVIDADAMLSELTQAVRRYGMEQRRAPATLEDLVAAGYLRNIPEAPAGKRFAVSKELRVYLADK
jgi:hypothetical protein